MKIILSLITGIVLGLNCYNCSAAGDINKNVKINLAANGQTDYAIIEPDNPTVVDKFAIKELATFLHKVTNANFPVKSSQTAATGTKRIFVGLSPAALKILGKNPLDKMSKQEHIARNIGKDIFLYGKGQHGNLYAVYDFLENTIGCRWYSAFGKMKIPNKQSLSLSAFNRCGKPTFSIRGMYTDIFFMRPEAIVFLYRNRLNVNVERHAKRFKEYAGIVDTIKMIPPLHHSLFYYMPPREKPLPGFNPPAKFLKNKNYFKTNPEFFSLARNGKRMENLQVCFSNKEMRRELTKNIEEQIKLHGGKGVLHLDQNDRPGCFCYCPECKKLQNKYACIGGPFFDYVQELGTYLQKKYPEVFIKFIVYRKKQTQKPPKGMDFPANIIPRFSPIDDNFRAAWNHPDNIETYNDLKDWCKLTKNTWVWYYPKPYCDYVPFGNIERLVNDMRLMKEAGVKGIFFEHDVDVTEGFGFTELQTYLMLKLLQDPHQDAAPLIKEFLDFQYGSAAPLVQQYLNELEKCRKNMKTFLPWSPGWNLFSYLNPENIHRWQKSFDEMEKLVSGNPDLQFNIKRLRLPLDISSLRIWEKCEKKYPDYFSSVDKKEKQIKQLYNEVCKKCCSPYLRGFMNARKKRFLQDLASIVVFAKIEAKPFPKQFSGIPEKNLRRIYLSRVGGGKIKKAREKDPDAAFGFAMKSELEKPFTFGFSDKCNKSQRPRRNLKLSEITPDVYTCYKLGTVELSQKCLVWLARTSWHTQAKLGRFYEPGELNKWDIYVSMKFEGPSYSKNSKSKKDQVLCDQVILVKADR